MDVISKLACFKNEKVTVKNTCGFLVMAGITV